MNTDLERSPARGTPKLDRVLAAVFHPHFSDSMGIGCPKSVVTTAAMRPGYGWRWSPAILLATHWAAAQTTTPTDQTRKRPMPAQGSAASTDAVPSDAVPSDPNAAPTDPTAPTDVTLPTEPSELPPSSSPAPETIGVTGVAGEAVAPAEPVAPPVAAPPFRKPEAVAPVLAPFAGDSLSGQFQVGVGGMFSVPFGEVSPGVDIFPKTDVGFGPAIDLGLGVARHFVVGAYGEVTFHGAASQCVDCSSQSWATGAFVRYHLVQGLRFDPWVSYGIGYRALNTDSASGRDSQYGGLEWLRVQFGGDWYATRQLGFGPFVELGAASFLSRPANEEAGGVNWRFQSGIRILLDLPGR